MALLTKFKKVQEPVHHRRSGRSALPHPGFAIVSTGAQRRGLGLLADVGWPACLALLGLALNPGKDDMMISLRRSLRLALLLWGLVACAKTPAGTAVEFPEGSPGIGFDDLRYSSSLHRVLVPSGRTGRLNLVDPDTLAVTSIAGFSAKAEYSGGHDDGPTSVEEALGRLYVTDRSTQTLVALDPASGLLGSRVALSAEPDYVRFVAAKDELWVTEPGADQIEIFSLDSAGTPVPQATIAVDNGPESLVIDALRGRAYTHRWQRTTVAIDVSTRAIVEEWPNGCAASRGIGLDEARGWLLSSCNEGTAAVLDVANGGRILSSIDRGSGFDVMGYNPVLGHVYLAGAACGCLVTLGATAQGQLQFLDRQSAPGSTHCAAADDVGHAWVCDPDGGQLWRVTDHHASTL
jgi:hypothetical protein